MSAIRTWRSAWRIALVLLLIPGGVSAHEVAATIGTATTTVVTLRYADGRPFAFEQYEVRAADREAPVQVGRTDAEGRAAIVPTGTRELTLTASSHDGHGARIRLPATSAGATSTEAPLAPDRWWRFALGLALLFGLFGLARLLLRTRRAPQ